MGISGVGCIGDWSVNLDPIPADIFVEYLRLLMLVIRLGMGITGVVALWIFCQRQ
nr:hypothetical protein [Tanacetum cinerariifolium]